MSDSRKKTKKVGSTGRFGVRYGSKIRKEAKKAEDTRNATHLCPRCGSKSVRRKSFAVWRCSKCGVVFAGGAYAPTTTSITNNVKNTEGE